MIGIIQYDKKLHFLINFFIVLFFGLFSILLGIGISIICSFGKELYDLFDYGLFDWKDILADFLGALLGLIILLCL